MSSENTEFNDQLIEEYLRYLRGRGLRPGTEDLAETERVAHEDLFRLLDAIVDADMAEAPPFEEDPVAIRLGLTGRARERAGETEASEVDVPPEIPVSIASSLADVVHQLEVEVVPARTNGEPVKTNGVRAFAECRSLGELVLICLMRSDDFLALPSAVAPMFALLPTLTAVAVVSSVTNEAVVLTPSDCVRAVDPIAGWVEPALPAPPEPLELALRRHLERSIPRWDEIARLDELLLLTHASEDVTAAVSESVRIHLGRTAKISAKKGALANLQQLPAEPIETVIHGIRAKRLAGEELTVALRNISEAEVS